MHRHSTFATIWQIIWNTLLGSSTSCTKSTKDRKMADGQPAQSALMSVACRMDLANTSLRCSCPLPNINNPTSGTRMPSKLSST
eukprot:CCRYP_008475-RA/>CCRYP_008475-RA protein AED:0.45 eAED:1.00 QI:0/0/0/1/0/0/2/0/83